MAERLLVVAPSWVGDAILSEPLLALLREPFGDPNIDVLAPPWCGPVYARMRGVARVIDNPLPHGALDLRRRRAVAAELRKAGYQRALVLPNSWKSALIPWLAGIPRRTGYRGEFRYGLLNDVRKLDVRAMPRLVDRFAALAGNRGVQVPTPPAPVLVPDVANRTAAVEALRLRTTAPVAVLCPGAEYGPAKRWPAEHFAALATRLLADGFQVWIVGSPNDKDAAAEVLRNLGTIAEERRVRDLTGRTDLGTAIDLLSLARVVVSNDSGLMHAAAAVGAPLVALFGSSSPVYTPPLAASARIARIDIKCSPCFKRECPLGHLRCLKDLAPATVYDLARTAAAESVAAP
jgi:heptosyltransferase-2